MPASLPHKSTGQLVAASEWNAHVDAINAIQTDSTGAIWTGRVEQVARSFRGLHLRTHPNALAAPSQVQILNADEIVMSDGTRMSSWAGQLADITVAGANGLDTGTEQSSTWYEIHAIGKDDGTKGLLLHRAKDYFNTAQQTTNTAAAEGLRSDAAHNRKAQSFVPSTTGAVPFAEISILKTGTPTGTMWLTIEADSAGRPSGTPLATSDKIDVAALSTAGTWVRFLFRTPATLAATTYHLVAYGDYAVSGTNFVYWLGNTAGGYASGKAQKFDSGTTVWSDQATDLDQVFKVYVTRNDTALTLPTGYTKTCKIGYVYNNSSNNFELFTQIQSRAQYLVDHLMVNGSTSTNEVLTDLSSILPPTPLRVWGAGQNTTNGATVSLGPIPDGYNMRTSTFANSVVVVQPAGANSMVTGFSSDLITHTQAVYFRVSAGTGFVWITGYDWSA